MDKVDFDYEVGNDVQGTKIYPSVKSLVENRRCVGECGIVKIKVELEEVLLTTEYRLSKEEQKKRIEELSKKSD